MKQELSMIEDFVENLIINTHEKTEWLQTTEGDEVECISIEELDGVIKRLLEIFKD